MDQNLTIRDELLQQLKANLEVSVNLTKQTTNKKRRDVTFEVGDMVFLKLHPYRQQTVFKRAQLKTCLSILWALSNSAEGGRGSL